MADPKNKGAEARARYAAARRGSNGFVQSEFINVNLNDVENADKHNEIPDYGALFDMINEEIENGYKITAKWDERGNCVSVFMQPTSEEHENAGFILTGRGGTAASALRECIYCHRTVLQGNWQNARTRNSRPSDDF